MSASKSKAIVIGVLGAALILLGVKYLPAYWALLHQPKGLQERPAVLFFNVDNPCECMLELAENAEQQIAAWPAERRGNLPVVHIWIEERKDLEIQYKVFRAPCLILIDSKGLIAWRQDYPLIKDGPFDLTELEAAIAGLEDQ